MIILIKWLPVDTSTFRPNDLFNCYFVFTTATDAINYHRLFNISTACPQNIYLPTFLSLRSFYPPFLTSPHLQKIQIRFMGR